LADGATLERHLPRRTVITAGFSLAVISAQETEQLDLFGAADRLLRGGETHAGFSQLREQLVHRSGQHRGQLLDCYVRHFLFTPDLPAIANLFAMLRRGPCLQQWKSKDQVLRAAIINAAARFSSTPSIASSISSSVA